MIIDELRRLIPCENGEEYDDDREFVQEISHRLSRHCENWPLFVRFDENGEEDEEEQDTENFDCEIYSDHIKVSGCGGDWQEPASFEIHFNPNPGKPFLCTKFEIDSPFEVCGHRLVFNKPHVDFVLEVLDRLNIEHEEWVNSVVLDYHYVRIEEELLQAYTPENVEGWEAVMSTDDIVVKDDHILIDGFDKSVKLYLSDNDSYLFRAEVVSNVETQPNFKKYVRITADYNDGDYATSSCEITDEQEAFIKKVVNVIKDLNLSNNWSNICGSRDYIEDYSEYLTEDELEKFDQFVPGSEFGVHSIVSVKIELVADSKELL